MLYCEHGRNQQNSGRLSAWLQLTTGVARYARKWNVYHAAIYLRLSKDDGDISFSSKKQESNSIQSQRELLTAFLRQHPEMELYGEYKDDGWTEPILTGPISSGCWRM